MSVVEQVGLISLDRDGGVTEVPLTGVSVKVGTKGPFARVTVTQEYENRETVPVEAVYVFPLEEGSAVSGFSVVIDDRTIRGKVLPRDEAFDRYDDAMADGHGAFLLDQERPNIFTASVGNLLPGQNASIELSYLVELAPEGDGVRLMIPTTVSPRYVPGSRRDFEGMTDAERISPPVSLGGVPYRMDLEVEADLLSDVRAVESPSHKIRAEIAGTKALVTLAGDEGALDRDFVLILVAEEPFRPQSMQARDREGDRFVLVSFRPELDLAGARPPVEVVFVVDCSGSMGGTSIEEARRTLLLCLQSLEPGDRFNIVRFGNMHEALFPASRAYEGATLDVARTLAGGMDADMGGTEILSPLKAVLSAPEVEGLPRRIVLLTDGEVANEDEVIELARTHRERSTIFSVGIGAGSSEHLVRGVARASGGAAEFVYPGETIEEKVLRHFDRIAAATATLSIEWEGVQVADVSPSEMPALVSGGCISFLARQEGGTEGAAVLSGEIAGRPFMARAEIREAHRDPEADRLLPVLWARRRIRELEESGDASRRGGSRQKSRARKRTDRELVRLGTRYGLMSRATSYVAIEERSEEQKSENRAELRRIPIALTKGWGGLGPVAGAAFSTMVGAPVPSRGMARRRGSITASFEMADLDMPEAPSEELRCMAQPDTGRPGLTRPGVLFFQNADGSWDLTRELAVECGADYPELRVVASTMEVADAERVLATLMAVILAEGKPRQEKEQLKLVIDKAKRWLARATAGATPPNPELGWEEWAAHFVQ